MSNLEEMKFSFNVGSEKAMKAHANILKEKFSACLDVILYQSSYLLTLANKCDQTQMTKSNEMKVLSRVGSLFNNLLLKLDVVNDMNVYKSEPYELGSHQKALLSIVESIRGVDSEQVGEKLNRLMVSRRRKYMESNVYEEFLNHFPKLEEKEDDMSFQNDTGLTIGDVITKSDMDEYKMKKLLVLEKLDQSKNLTKSLNSHTLFGITDFEGSVKKKELFVVKCGDIDPKTDVTVFSKTSDNKSYFSLMKPQIETVFDCVFTIDNSVYAVCSYQGKNNLLNNYMVKCRDGSDPEVVDSVWMTGEQCASLKKSYEGRERSLCSMVVGCGDKSIVYLSYKNGVSEGNMVCIKRCPYKSTRVLRSLESECLVDMSGVRNYKISVGPIEDRDSKWVLIALDIEGHTEILLSEGTNQSERMKLERPFEKLRKMSVMRKEKYLFLFENELIMVDWGVKRQLITVVKEACLDYWCVSDKIVVMLKNIGIVYYDEMLNIKQFKSSDSTKILEGVSAKTVIPNDIIDRRENNGSCLLTYSADEKSSSLLWLDFSLDQGEKTA